jgi:hypothetical protein
VSSGPAPGSVAWLVRSGQDALFAAVGLAVTATESLPALVDKGRTELENRLRLPRTIGAVVISQAERQIRRRFGSRFSPSAPAPPPHPAPPAPSDAAPQSAPGHVTVQTPPPAVVELAIPEYDSLSASQVVRRLAGLSADELSAVATYESSTRKRRTVLSRIAQLQGGGSPSSSDPD